MDITSQNPITETTTCSSCFFNIDQNDTFCTNCGYPLKGSETDQKDFMMLKSYKEINLRGMKLVKPGGFLVTASCTNLVPPEMFLEIIGMAAKDAKRTLRQVCWQTQAADHPIIWNIPTTQYLKFLIVQVL